MRTRTIFLAAVFIVAVPAPGQTPAGGTQGQPSERHQPAVPAQSNAAPAAQPGQTESQAPSPAAKPDPAKEAAIRHLMEITETSKLGDNIQGAIKSQVRNVMSRTLQPDQLPKFMDTFSTKLTASAPASAVTDAMVPIYAKHFSTEEIQAITQFYESPAGQRLVKEMPEVAQETHSAGLQLEENAAMNVLQSMSDEYPELKQLIERSNEGSSGGEAPAPAPSAAPPAGASPATTPPSAPAPPQK